MSETLFFRTLAEYDKATMLEQAIQKASEGNVSNSTTYVAETSSFSQIPGSTFAYWVSEQTRHKFVELTPFESNGREARVGDHPGDGFRYLRLFWEISSHINNRDWVAYQKGGSYSPYYSDIHLLVDWDKSRQTYRGFHGRTGRPNERPSNYQYFFRTGLTWSSRTTREISFRILPRDCIFSHKGPVAFAPQQQILHLLAILNSKAFGTLVALRLGAADAAARSYEVGLIQKTPVPNLSNTESKSLSELALKCVDLKRQLDTANEGSHLFYLPALLQNAEDSIKKSCFAWQRLAQSIESQLIAHQERIDDIVYSLYNFSDADRLAIETMGAGKKEEIETNGTPPEEDDENPAIDANKQLLAVNLLSYIIGCVFGRWDIRYAIGERQAPELPDPFAPLPVCSPGVLIGENGLPLRSAPTGYPLEVKWDGIIVDDPEHSDDIVRHVRDVLGVIWQEKAEAIEQEICQILEITDLREYFRRHGKDGFWGEHIQRYSKSRRKAPIYWLLQSEKRSYGIWLYYHRLDKDLLFKVLVNYVEPKVRFEATRLEQLQAQKSAGLTGRETRQFERQIERQERLLSDVGDFRDKLSRAAHLGLEPDLNDGVVLNIALLHELVPWGEARKYWEELMAGKYGWSSVSQQLRAKGKG